MSYDFKTKPFDHQREQFERSKDMASFGVLWEQGTGKSKLIVDTAAYLFLNGKIDGLFILAPDVIHENWIINEIPVHMPDMVHLSMGHYTYHCSKAGTQKHARALKDLNVHNGMAVLAMTYDGLATAHGRKAAHAFMSKRKVISVSDESTRIKTPKVARTRAALTLTDRSHYSRILTGTPVPNSPFDLYSQMRFLDHNIWRRLGINTFQGFKTMFGIWSKGWNSTTQREFDILDEYRNLPKLKAYIDQFCSRVTKDEVLDLPEKKYNTVMFELSPKQRRMYDQMKENFFTLLDDGSLATTELVITQMLRLRQIAAGYIVSDEGDYHVIDPNNNPRMKALLGKTTDYSYQGIIWASFHKDVDLICKELGECCIRCDGKVPAEDRLAIANEFQAGKHQWLVSNPAAMGEGFTLTAARSVHYFNNGPRLDHRLQSEDRAHRIGQKFSVDYYDYLGIDTIDQPILESLMNKLDVACQITGDNVRQWVNLKTLEEVKKWNDSIGIPRGTKEIF